MVSLALVFPEFLRVSPSENSGMATKRERRGVGAGSNKGLVREGSSSRCHS